MKILLTGGTGFVGHHLQRKLVALGWEVDALVRPTSDCSRLDPAVTPRVWNGHSGSLCDLLKQSNPDIVFHLATHFLARHVMDDIPALVRSNIEFPSLVLEAMREAGCSRFINTSTTWVHVGPLANEAASFYAATKQAFDQILRFYQTAYQFQATTLTLCDTYGPSDLRGKVLSLLINAALSGQKLEMSPGEQCLDLVHVDDVSEGFIQAARLLQNGVTGTFSITSGHLISLKNLAQKVAQATRCKLMIEWGGRPYRAGEIMLPWQGGVPLPGWTPMIDLDDGIKGLLS
ncbi:MULTISPECIES: NAD-dependent epimerase/dehydratase family protein [Acetobacter]|mgnify:FL=1|jgi:nucleoside-diphosphate-sugar epimerase|uniref:Nucleoside-diphosphate-sugar epimerase n=1 Tax=Acetobacter lovaniensis TaxID=104100 RepID=A0A841QG13_9PROT|nr:NAD(P)-dependent oxidoreductase [Acetobacter lovaniensis]MBB6457194.1 nucleoside-diphosphate-sugar epimerase [Acetobacter lovaniensis]MCI1697774.1 NAD(P)-dependent oxidoreductase [Acetobacter lovaniensis]MCI1795799.1 NAD(P)-dependent oxidoreductase [Acetobacter lovaniensis]MCP1239464.1 NAD(P)-dependent oxidoreductase [Acetobacter lovaniensis]NHN81227.1 NAD-dependent epimerase/dehydratase family protein [Acetobacter lovaniensis]